MLASYRIAPGNVFSSPAGRIHAIGAGAFVAEIQQTSDLTYRIYDYGRLGLDGKPRELHIEQAKEAIDYDVYPDYRTEYSASRTPRPNWSAASTSPPRSSTWTSLAPRISLNLTLLWS